MVKELKKEYPNFKIVWGMTTSSGSKFLKKLPRTLKSGQWRINIHEIRSPHGPYKKTDKKRDISELSIMETLKHMMKWCLM